MDKKHAKKMGISAGDTVEITLNSNGIFPTKKQMKLIDYIDSSINLTYFDVQKISIKIKTVIKIE